MLRPLPAVLAITVVTSLACGGGGPGGGPSEVPGVEFAPQTDPEPTGPKAAEGLGAELGFPFGQGEVRVNEPARVHVLHPMAFDASLVWEPYVAGLEASGWARTNTAVPPFRGLFTKDRKRVLVTCDLAGSSVWVKAEVVR